jgi:Amt family ammonium transporter
MNFFTFKGGGRWNRLAFMGLGMFLFTNLLSAQTETNSELPGPGQISADHGISATNAPTTNSPPVVPPVTSAPTPLPPAPVSLVESPPPPAPVPSPATNISSSLLAALMTLASLAGFLLYQCGLSRAKNTGHTSTLLLVGVLFGLAGYWIGGFAVQTGGVGDAHAALAQPLPAGERSGLDHELGFMAFGHHWGLMGSSGFFLITDDPARNGITALFLSQAVLLSIALAAALGAALERGKLLAMAFCAYLIGVLIYPLLANWVWGGGWLAELGREYGLGHGFVDLAGAGVVHETAGTLALVMAVVLGPRLGRFRRNNSSNPFPGHNLPFVLLGSIVLLISWMATNAFAGGAAGNSDSEAGTSTAGLAAVNTLLSATGGLVTSFALAAWQKRRPEPALLVRGLLGGAVASCGCAALIDPWAAFVIGGTAGLLIQAAMNYLELARIDDPVGAAAVHGVGGAWGVLAVGLFANGAAGIGFNGVTGPVRGLFFGGAWHQLAAQLIGCVTGFVVVYILGYACISLVGTILGNRVDLAHETSGLDGPEVGALGYQGDAEPEDIAPKGS